MSSDRGNLQNINTLILVYSNQLSKWKQSFTYATTYTICEHHFVTTTNKIAHQNINELIENNYENHKNNNTTQQQTLFCVALDIFANFYVFNCPNYEYIQESTEWALAFFIFTYLTNIFMKVLNVVLLLWLLAIKCILPIMINHVVLTIRLDASLNNWGLSYSIILKYLHMNLDKLSCVNILFQLLNVF